MDGWWATAAHALAFVLALAVALPTAGLAEDLAYHQGHSTMAGRKLVMASDLMPASARKATPALPATSIAVAMWPCRSTERARRRPPRCLGRATRRSTRPCPRSSPTACRGPPRLR